MTTCCKAIYSYIFVACWYWYSICVGGLVLYTLSSLPDWRWVCSHTCIGNFQESHSVTTPAWAIYWSWAYPSTRYCYCNVVSATSPLSCSVCVQMGCVEGGRGSGRNPDTCPLRPNPAWLHDEGLQLSGLGKGLPAAGGVGCEHIYKQPTSAPIMWGHISIGWPGYCCLVQKIKATCTCSPN